ncbi:glycosyltransferase [Tuwongella immobilis]|uniref:Glycosyl transferase family 1 domain-containing protein n=1 Tax=Tuwongella immobilis TaxID=692036 RepID=A0A6C2YP73_9BACT|nr:glycosyltransferase [Tuwongella immobilis]VIP02933.1 glycosyl transferase family 1 : Glycosyltransferase OS=Singulisphaera acidiphila (strain ATCC BAA-1392 / DSM 18658 / VKM B-2454 / MOB10) GN=Sinac_7482 PE=4 SV=1: Glyco_trans_4_3: Glycos_transf_1 [Tuwongella immobilis]VTS02887.1 glycosyl transferase family 1 : Glycosyltransferase OS=Singulisphaera acidiphila (strain ATCC BAA-1392 / DSM 18658 / VKM B-2454 / MOB10) GN=Sinac_7482 PE=4 SV=1: Glyco_trans_4_3: Glycos_transf_1 [Tuwongella immobilis]
MHILFIHDNFPAQFGHLAAELVRRHGDRCTFLTGRANAQHPEFEVISYRQRGGATEKTHYCSRTFENQTWQMEAVYRAVVDRADLRPDVIVGHSGLGPTLWLREHFDCPIVCFFEYYYSTRGADLDFRPDFPSSTENRLRAMNRNAFLLLDLENSTLGYSPTEWQRQRFPSRYRDKIRTIFDGIDCQLWQPMSRSPRRIGERVIPDDVPVLTYATRGMESMRGFDIFMKVAKRLMDRMPSLQVLIAGQDRAAYGNDARHTGMASFKDWVLSQDNYDRSRIHFLGLIPPRELAQLFSITDLHIYLTIPFVLSWSLLNALACGATVLASATAPVQEIIRHGENGLLADFFDVDGLTEQAWNVLQSPERYRHLGEAGRQLVQSHYSIDVCLPKFRALLTDAIHLHHAGRAASDSGSIRASNANF